MAQNRLDWLGLGTRPIRPSAFFFLFLFWAGNYNYFAQYRNLFEFCKGKGSLPVSGGCWRWRFVLSGWCYSPLFLLFFCFLCSLFPGLLLFIRLCLRFQVSPVLFVPSSCVLLFWSFSLFIPFLLFSSVLCLHPQFFGFFSPLFVFSLFSVIFLSFRKKPRLVRSLLLWFFRFFLPSLPRPVRSSPPFCGLFSECPLFLPRQWSWGWGIFGDALCRRRGTRLQPVWGSFLSAELIHEEGDG